MSYLKLSVGLLLAVILTVLGIVRVAFEVIGASTAPDDFALLQERMPKVMAWLFTTPWPVPTLLLISATLAAAYLLWSGTKTAAREGAPAVREDQDFADRLRIAEEKIMLIGSAERADDAQLPLGEGSNLQIHDDVASLRADVIDLLKKVDRYEASSKDYADGIRDGLSARMSDIERSLSSIQEDQGALVARVVTLLRARDAERTLTDVNEQIEQYASSIIGPITDEESNIDWRKWRGDVGEFHRLVGRFWRVAKPYSDSASSRLPAIDPDSFRDSIWSFNRELFPDIDLAHEYKKVCLTFKDHQVARGDLISIVTIAARP